MQKNMTNVTTKDFQANQTKFLDMALCGEHVVPKSRRGSFQQTPIEEEEPNVTSQQREEDKPDGQLYFDIKFD